VTPTLTKPDDRTASPRRLDRHTPARWLRAVITSLRLDFGGLVGAYLFFCVSLTPSLVPRAWVSQALLSGIAVTIGYALGRLVSLIVSLAKRGVAPNRMLPRRFVLASWWVMTAIGVGTSATYLLASADWQAEARALMDRPGSGPNHLLILVIAALVFAIFLLIGRGLRAVARRLHRILGRRIPVPVAAVVSVSIVAAITYWASTGLLYPWAMSTANNAFETINQTTSEGSVEPTSEYRSGGPGSLVTWDSLGRKGREFIGAGPGAADIEDFTGRSALEPIRAYVGIDAAEDLDKRAALAVDELDRTGGFDREVLVVATTTGTGWIDPAAADSLEYMHGGDTAIVGIQYSYLPSWLSFLVDEDEARQAARVLLDAVRERWLTEPEPTRPQLIVYGESLGAMGSADAFDDLAEITEQVDGALWVGTPDSSRLHRQLTGLRETGSAVVQPVVDGGRTVRFWNQEGDVPGLTAPWESPRVLFLQHASDPVVWWSPDLLWQRPQWLREPLADDVLPTLSWFPFVTFWQITGDMAVAAQVPDGFGHRYAAEHVEAWNAIAPPAEWAPEESQELKDMLRDYCPVATAVVSVVGSC
jgi:uncharacterized membrane protein